MLRFAVCDILSPSTRAILYIKSSANLAQCRRISTFSECRNCHVYISTGQLRKISHRYTRTIEPSLCFLCFVKEDILLQSEGEMLNEVKKKETLEGCFLSYWNNWGKMSMSSMTLHELYNCRVKV